MDIKVKNKALLNRWLWHYGNEPNGLWRCIVAERLGSNHRNLTPSLHNSARMFKILKNVIKPLYGGSYFSTCIIEGLSIFFRNRGIIEFWDDKWINGYILKFEFP